MMMQMRWRMGGGFRFQDQLDLPLGIVLQVSPDSKLLALGIDDRIQLWNLTTGKLVRLFGGHDVAVRSLAFSPDGKLLAAGSQDQSIRLWQVTGAEVAQLRGHRGAVHELRFAGDGKTLVSAGEDGTALIWDLPAAIEAARRRPLRTASDQKLAKLWADLETDNALRAYAAICELAATPRETVPFLKERLRPAVVDTQRIARLVTELDAKQFAVRDKAMQELERLGEAAGPALRKALAGEAPPEVRRRVEQLLEKLHQRVKSAESLRLLRALEVLEQLGTPEARKVLETLAQGARQAPLTQEATMALERLGR